MTLTSTDIAEGKFRCLADTMPAALFVHQGDKLIYANAAAGRMLGVTRDELLAMSFWEIVPEAEQEVWLQRGQARLSGAEEPSVHEYVLVARDGTEHCCQCHAALIDYDGQPAVLLSATDISDLKRTEQALHRAHDELEMRVSQRTAELARTQAQLLQSDKLASIGQLAAGVAHEINNPIGYVQSNLATLARYLEDVFRAFDAYADIEQRCAARPELAGELNAVRDSADLEFLAADIPQLLKQSAEGINRVRKIVADLKDFSRSDASADWEWADLHACLESTLNIAHNELKYCAQVKREYGQLPPVRCLPSQLNQVFLNLLVNAGHAIERPPGTITIRTGCRDEQAWIEIRDTGKGMSAETQAKIFDPFFTTKPIGQGTGLGLSLAYGVIEKHHGRIEVESALGVGSVFRVVIPLEPQVEDGSDEAATAGNSALQGMAA